MLTHKVMRLLLVLAVAFTGFIPQTAGAAEPEPEPVPQVAAAGPATIQNYPMPSIYTPSAV